MQCEFGAEEGCGLHLQRCNQSEAATLSLREVNAMATAKKTAGNKAAAKKSSDRKYSPAASKSVKREMKAMKEGKLESGSGEKVTNPKQAIAIGLSEARRAGAKVPLPPKKAAAKTPGKKAAAKKAASA